ncbi:MAG: hypothetical protein P8Y64_04060 [Gammaproteobacteria bacterium]|jgi:toxin CptA
MSLRPSAPTLRIEPRPSRWLLGWTLGLHLLAALAVLLAGFTLYLTLPLECLVLGSLYATVGRRRQTVITQAAWDADGQWKVAGPGLPWQPATLCDDTWVGPWLVILNFRFGDKRRHITLPLFRDAVDADIMRRLRIRLRREAGRPVRDPMQPEG